MRLLAIETSTEACSVAVFADGDVRERFEVAPRRHAELVLPWAAGLLAEAGLRRAQLDAVAVGRGPGAFTGVRLGISIAQGIALALDRPLLPESTLAVLAAGAGEGRVLAAIDARMGEVYLGAFEVETGVPRLQGREAVMAPAAAALPDGDDWRGIGTGFAAAEGALPLRLGHRLASFDATALPRAGHLARLAARSLAAGGGVAPERVEPAYLRDNVALTLAEQSAARERRG